MPPAELREQLQITLGTAYSIERELGGGGMSRVFVADDRALDRKVVVKVLSPELAAGVSAERFAREVKVAARLQQANIVPVLTAGTLALEGGADEAADARTAFPYYTMPFVEGLSLRDRLRAGGALPLGEAVHILRDIAKALSYAHERGVAHRDIKPENVLISGGTAMVTDFGIAKALAAAVGSGPGPALTNTGPTQRTGTLTFAGVSLGTPAYMAPEQAAADRTADHRVDIYALGIIAYEMLSGRHPFADRTTPSALLAAQMAETPEELASKRAEIPPALAALVMRCVEKDPARRPLSAIEVLHALDGVVTPTPSGVSAAHTAQGRRRLVQRIVVAVAVLVAAAGALLFAWRVGGGPAGATREQSLAVLPFANVGGDTANAYFALGMADELTTALAKVPNLRVAARSSAFSFQGKQVDVRDVAKALNVGAVLEGTVRRSGDKLRVSAQLTSARDGLVLWSESYEREVRDVFTVQDDISRAIVSALRVTLGSAPAPAVARGTTSLEAYDLFLRGGYFLDRRGAVNLRNAIESFERAVAADSAFVRAHAGLSRALVTLPFYTTASMAEVLPRAMAAAERAVALDSGSVYAHVALGSAHLSALRWVAAEAELRHAIAIDSSFSAAHFNLGRVLLFTGRIEESYRELTTARQLDPLVSIHAALVATSLSLLGRHDEAVAEATRSYELDPTLFATIQSLSLAYLHAGRHADARALARAALDKPGDYYWRGTFAYVLGRTGDRGGAEQLVRELLRRPEGEWRRSAALSRAYLGLGDTARALAELEHAAGTTAGELIPLTIPLNDPMYDPIRQSPRFAGIVRQLGLDGRGLTTPTGGRPR